MHPAFTPYAPGTAVLEYQARLSAQKTNDADVSRATPVGELAGYDLTARLPNWAYLLDMEKPQVWSTADLTLACARLQDPACLPDNTSSTRILDQLAAFEAELAARA